MSYLNKNCTLGHMEESRLAGRRAGTFNGFELIPFEGHKDLKTLISKAVWLVD